MQQRLPRLVNEPILFAHRGARAHAPENTLEAFQLALRLGANGLETDVWLSKDGVVVVDHDGYRRSKFSKRWIRSYRCNEMPFSVPTLDELLDALPLGTFRLSIDIKDEAAFLPVVKSLAGRNCAEQVYVCHPDLSVLEKWASVQTGVNLVHSTSPKELINGSELHASALVLAGVHVCNMHHTNWSGGLAALYHRFGVAAFAWDVQHAAHATNLLRMGIDGLYGDDVSMLYEAMTND